IFYMNIYAYFPALLSAVVVLLLLTTAGQCAMLTDDLQITATPDLSNSTLTPQMDTSTMEGPRVLRSHRPCSSEHANYCHNGGECMFPQDSVEPSCICTPAYNGPRCMYIVGHIKTAPQLEKMIGLTFGVIMFILVLAIVMYFLAYKNLVTQGRSAGTQCFMELIIISLLGHDYNLLRAVVCSALGTQGSEATFSGELAGVTGGPASGEGLQSLSDDDDELEIDEEVSGGDNQNFSHGSHPSGKDERKKKKGKGKKRKHKSKSTTAFNPEHTLFTNGYTSTISTTEDPCTSTHLGYCIHGYCKYIEGLQEPVCICMKGYDGERCGIQTLGVRVDQSSNTELVQTILVIIAVVLSVISCTAILLMTCAHYRSHKNFLASYLGTGTEQEKLQKPIGDVVV
ncbi:Proheparin-binding EGF-like growth factor, partial [Nibea albiflora]